MPFSDDGTQERLRAALAAELSVRGCPADRARIAVAGVQHGRWSLFPVSSPDVQGWLEWRGTSVWLDDPDDSDQVASAVEHLAENMAAENAEAWDRGTEALLLWPLPDRRPRH